ncbi:MAG TPA: anti-sigma factor, partial [Candidatus Limnocylindrales bacterium]
AVPASRAPLRVGRRWASAWLLRVAAVLVLAALGATSLLLGQQLAAERAYADELSRALSLAAAPGSRVTVLAPATPAASPAAGASAAGVPAGLGVVPPSGPGLLVMHDLAPTSGGQVYEAWAIVGSGAPAPLGSFSVGSDGRGWLEGISVAGPGPLTLALTREPGPGATKPTLPIVSSGTARPGA